MRSAIIYIILFLINASVFSQSALDRFITDVKTASEYMMQSNGILLKANYYLYTTHESSEVSSTTSSTTYLSDKLYYQQIEGVHTIIFQDKVAIIDIDEKTIVFDRTEVDFINMFLSFDIDKSLQFIECVEALSSNTYDIFYNTGSIEHMTVKVNQSTRMFEAVELYYSQSYNLEDKIQDEEWPRLLIKYGKVNSDARQPFYWDNNPFFLISNDELQLKDKYSHYYLIDNLKTE